MPSAAQARRRRRCPTARGSSARRPRPPQDHLAGGTRAMRRSPSCDEGDAGGAPAVEDDPLDMHAGFEPQVGAVQDRLEEAARRAPAPAALLVDLEVGGALVVAGVEVVDLRDAGRRGGLADRVEDVPADARMLDPPLAAAAVERVRRRDVVLVLQEIRAARRPSPSRSGRAGASRRSRPPGRACRSWR